MSHKSSGANRSTSAAVITPDCRKIAPTEMTSKPRPFKDLSVHDVKIRILSDVALIHGRSTYTVLADGAEQEALYTDTYQKRGGTWVCVSAWAIAPGT
ncbi:nuclear transport factor 2 family protein [Streptomyces sp. NPDC001833]|uniref:nuclear transport factor 2 family protein n=1 Tax=Streptomyces sp. NPDC001833 TaxID=3154658 RepID=UPI00331C3189